MDLPAAHVSPLRHRRVGMLEHVDPCGHLRVIEGEGDELAECVGRDVVGKAQSFPNPLPQWLTFVSLGKSVSKK